MKETRKMDEEERDVLKLFTLPTKTQFEIMKKKFREYGSEFYSTDEVAKLVMVSQNKVRRMIQRGELRAIKRKNKYYVVADDITRRLSSFFYALKNMILQKNKMVTNLSHPYPQHYFKAVFPHPMNPNYNLFLSFDVDIDYDEEKNIDVKIKVWEVVANNKLYAINHKPMIVKAKITIEKTIENEIYPHRLNVSKLKINEFYEKPQNVDIVSNVPNLISTKWKLIFQWIIHRLISEMYVFKDIKIED